jgi:hypothetical protein
MCTGAGSLGCSRSSQTKRPSRPRKQGSGRCAVARLPDLVGDRIEGGCASPPAASLLGAAAATGPVHCDDAEVPQGAYATKEQLAVEVVRQAEIARGWEPTPLLGQHAQHVEGCDLLSTPPGGGPPRAIEVKGWGEPLLRPDGSCTYPADLNAEQLERAKRDADCRLVLVGNLDAVMAGTGRPKVLAMTATEVVERAVGWRYRVPLERLDFRVMT